ncbi:hypothetical protein D3C81_1440330 [compost metagenome]
MLTDEAVVLSVRELSGLFDWMLTTPLNQADQDPRQQTARGDPARLDPQEDQLATKRQREKTYQVMQFVFLGKGLGIGYARKAAVSKTPLTLMKNRVRIQRGSCVTPRNNELIR